MDEADHESLQRPSGGAGSGLPSALRQLSSRVPRSLPLLEGRSQGHLLSLSAALQVAAEQARMASFSTTQQQQQQPHHHHRNEPQVEEQQGANLSISIDLGDDHTVTMGGNPNPATSSEEAQPSPETVALLSLVQRYLPFVLILLAKSIFDHGIGILVSAALLVTFSHANSRLKREVALQGRRSLGALAFLAAHVAVCVALLYTVFEDQRLYTSLWLAPSLSNPLTLGELLWLVVITDFVLKLVTVLLKVAVTALPNRLLAYPRRGGVFLAVEASSQLYRALAPLQPWLIYMVQAYHGAYKLVGVCLSAAYLVCKCREIVARARAWKDATTQMCAYSRLGRAPTATQLNGAGPMCAICHEEFCEPVCLPTCSHIFCEACLSAWADREPSCPLCRAKLGADPAWRDGATTFFVQLF